MASQSKAEFSLSFGALRRLLEGQKLQNVTLQILGYKQIPGSNNNRFRLLLNDGTVLFPYAILATQLNNLIYENHLEKFTIFMLKEYEYSQLLADKKVIICIDIEILVPGSEVNEKISEKVHNSDENLSGREIFTPDPPLSTVRQINFNTQPSTSYEQNWHIAPSGINDKSPSKSREEAQFSTISSLSPYRNKWSIKARLSYKSPIYDYCNVYGQGKWFSFHLMDDSGEIRAVAFNEYVEKYYELLEVFKIYIISNADIKLATEYSIIKCDFEMTVENHTKIEFYADDETSIPKPVFNFKTISSLNTLPKDSFVDVIGVCYKIAEISNVTTRNKELAKRSIFLIDKSKKSLIVTLWGASAKSFAITTGSVVAVKNARLSNYNGCSLSSTSASLFYIDPNFYKTFELRAWYQKVGSHLTHSEPSDVDEQTATPNWKTLTEIFDYPIMNLNTPLYHTTKATIVMVKKDCMYQACTALDCLKKVNSLNGIYKCEKCNIESSNFKWVYLLTFQIADFSRSHWVRAFNEVAENLIDVSSNDLNQIKRVNSDKYFEILNNLNLKTFIFKLRSNWETYNDDTNLKTSVLSFSPVEPKFCSKKLLNDIKNMSRLLYGH